MNKRRTLKLTILSLLLSLGTDITILPARIASAQSGQHGIDLKSIAVTIQPCQDFYLYANGHWLAWNPVPADRTSWGAGSELYEKNLAVLHQILEDAARNTPAAKGSATRKVSDFYRVGMDEAKIEADGAKPLEKEFASIAAIKDIPTLQDEIAHLHRLNINPAYMFFAYHISEERRVGKE